MLLPTVVATPRRGPVPRPPELVRDATRLAAAAAPLEGSQECASAWSREARVVPAAGGSVGLLAGFLAAASSSTANASSDASRSSSDSKTPFKACGPPSNSVSSSRVCFGSMRVTAPSRSALSGSRLSDCERCE